MIHVESARWRASSVLTGNARGPETQIFGPEDSTGIIDSRADMDYCLQVIRLFSGGSHPMATSYRKPGMWIETGDDGGAVVCTFFTGARSGSLLRAGRAILECR